MLTTRTAEQFGLRVEGQSVQLLTPDEGRTELGGTASLCATFNDVSSIEKFHVAGDNKNYISLKACRRLGIITNKFPQVGQFE